ncbi:hypothetical protein JTB14_006072 [Gonioctena quinquepunctata]|nr:hypothetical protein JTB14_006072 [Gonioctena quinquepunctata]
MSKDREEILKKKREAEKARLARIKNDPIKLAEYKEKQRIEEMSEDITKKKELVKKAFFGEVIKIQLEENYTKIKSHEDKRKFKQAISGNG